MLRLLRLWRLLRHDWQLLVFALRHRARPIWLWPAVIALGLYAIEPFNLAIPVLGVLDDLVLVPLALHLLLSLLPRDIVAGFAESRRAFG